ncbi:MAG TPA: OmpA family protein [Longimicrobium sp.]|nr:OmpA family protein [Longimicrobium sp.]
MSESDEDPTVWIGYADLMTTLVVLFFALYAAAAIRSREGEALLRGTVRDARSGAVLPGCAVRLGIARESRTAADGSFAFRLAELRTSVPMDARVVCSGYGRFDDTVRVAPGDTTELAVVLRPLRNAPAADSAITVRVIPGDALFDRNDYELRAGAVDQLRKIGLDLRSALRPGQVVAVQGHTDDRPFPAGTGKDNWVLSGERAAAAARILTDPAHGVGLPQCRVIIMGFGPGHPRQPVTPGEPVTTREAKRTANRRIEFRVLQGGAVTGGICDEP